MLTSAICFLQMLDNLNQFMQVTSPNLRMEHQTPISHTFNKDRIEPNGHLTSNSIIVTYAGVDF
jgi:hypothetical protein